ncbi:MAG: hypothetical protein QOF14_5666 [Hyphomicrobiales bacterium]|jgi:hypothetical protein|nr:hypothetical protein [Hyphomicrobiales bacterium]
MADRAPRFRAGSRTPADCFQHAVTPLKRRDVRLRHDFHVGQSGDPVDEVARHGPGQVRSANDHPDLGGLACQIDRGLPRRISSPDQGDFLSGAQLSFQWRRPIVDARHLESVEVVDIEPPVLGAAGKDHGTRSDLLVLGELEQKAASLRLKAPHLGRDCHLGSKFLRLVVGPRHQGDAGDTSRKTEIVFDPGGRACLTAEGAAIEHKNRKALRGCVNSGREAGRTRAHNHHVIDAIGVDGADQADAARKFDLAWIAQQLPVGAKHDRELARIDVKALDERLGLRVRR